MTAAHVRVTERPLAEVVPENRIGYKSVFHREVEGYAISTRRRLNENFKAKVALEALRGDKTLQEIATRYNIHPNQVSTWKQRAVEGMKDVFVKGAERSRGEHEAEIRYLRTRSSGVDGGVRFFGQRAQVVSREKRRGMIRSSHPKLGLSRQCHLLRVSRSSHYHRPKGDSAEKLALIRLTGHTPPRSECPADPGSGVRSSPLVGT